MVKGKKKRRSHLKMPPRIVADPSGPPIHPGYVVRRDLLVPSGLTEKAFGERIGRSRCSVCAIVSGTRGVSQDTAERLEAAFGADAVQLRMMQVRYDAFMRRRRLHPPPDTSPAPPNGGPAGRQHGPA